MDNTLDSIKPSYNPNPEEEMSYLFGRDPSISSYGQRPCALKDSRKNLLSVYEVEDHISMEDNGSVNLDPLALQTVKVYLRLKPFPKKMKLTQEQQDAYKIINSTSLFTRLPTLENNTSCIKRSNSTDIICRKFTFTHTFGPETTQLELFEQAVKPHMIDFLAGQNSTIMTYGTINSGKSYTLQGTTTSPGIIPRCLEFVFSNITTKSTASYKPVNHCDVVCLDPLERAQELEIKTKLLTFASMDKHHYINAYTEMQKLLQEESPIRPSQCVDAHYSVWVSFAEIYNEIVYDLLSNETQKKRTSLKLATDVQGRAFIKGLKAVCVNSGSEAYQVLMAGQCNLKVAATALNARSSRSHCIFTIKLLKYYVENDSDSVEVSTFAFCDLAGSERLKKTLNIGDRLKEAQNINTSLLVLGRCLKTIHDGQLSKQKIEHVGPFRESKLTRLFQKALSGKEHIALIVNINPLPNLYIETQNVLNFSAIAKKIVIEQKQKIQKKKSRFSQIVSQSIKTVTDWDATELESEEWHNTADDVVFGYVQAEDYDELVNENESLKKEIASLKSSALTRDLQIRQEMADTYTIMMKEIEVEWKKRIKDVEEQQEDVLQWSVKQVEDFYKQKLDQLSCRKRKRPSNAENDADDLKNMEELECENSRLTSKIVLLKSSVKELKESNQSLTVDKNKISFELGLIKEDLAKELAKITVKYDDLKSQHKEKCLMLEKLEQEVLCLKQKLESLDEESNSNKLVIEEYKQSNESLQKQLTLIRDSKTQLEETLRDSDNVKTTLETKISGYEEQLNKFEKELSHAKDNLNKSENELSHAKNELNKSEEELSHVKDDYNQCMEKLNILQADFNSHISKCKDEHEETISKLQKDLCGALERSDIKSKCLDVHAAKITELEHDLETITDLRQQIEELNKSLEICQDEKEHLQKLLDEKNDKLLEFEDRLEHAKEIQEEKDAEIMFLQAELKLMIPKTDSDDRSEKLMEIEIKNRIRDLTEAKEELSRKDEYIENLEMRVQTYEQNVKVLELLQQSAQERQAENERLRSRNEELKNSLTEKEREMEAFMKNRDEMVTKYESLVKNQQEELEKRKQMITKNSSKKKELLENTSDDEAAPKERRARQAPRKYSPTPNESVIELSGSESKRSAKRTVRPPTTETSSERKRNTRKKKLYLTADESCQDIEPLESTVTITPEKIPRRNLRSRRK